MNYRTKGWSSQWLAIPTSHFSVLNHSSAELTSRPTLLSLSFSWGVVLPLSPLGTDSLVLVGVKTTKNPADFSTGS